VELKKKRELPQIIEMMNLFVHLDYPWLDNRKVNFIPLAAS
jgi:hypothetical protein